MTLILCYNTYQKQKSYTVLQFKLLKISQILYVDKTGFLRPEVGCGIRISKCLKEELCTLCYT